MKADLMEGMLEIAKDPNSDEAQADSEETVASDSESEEATAESESEENEDAESEEDYEEDKTKSDTTSEEVNFDFRDTNTSIQKLVTNLSNLSDTERRDKISSLTRKKEIDAAKEAFPEAFKEEKPPVTREEYEVLSAKLERLTNSEKAMENLAKLEAASPKLEVDLRNRMLADLFGKGSEEVLNEAKFINAWDKYPHLEIEDRLEIACQMSPIARRLAVAGDVEKEVRTQKAKTVKKGKAVEAKEVEVTAKELLTPEGMAKALKLG